MTRTHVNGLAGAGLIFEVNGDQRKKKRRTLQFVRGSSDLESLEAYECWLAAEPVETMNDVFDFSVPQRAGRSIYHRAAA